MNDRDLESIIEANNDNRLAFFIGSGISKSAETENITMPLWGEVIKILKDDMNGIEEEDYLKLAQLYFLEYGEFLYYDKLKKIFDKDLEPSEIHKLIFEINPDYVITTNWDKLLDNTISNNAFIYDVVVNDTDLVKSTIQKKLIKMHGDFEHHNIVFKEDDYLNYQHNFPLIENFIKSILSTHTVVFLGYSYSDYNLKQIMKWIQSFSTVKPPVYKIGFSNRNSEIKYLENHGIKTLVLDVKDSRNTKECNEAIEKFLLRIKSKNVYRDNDKDLTYTDVVNYFYEKLLPLDNVNILMPEQIEKIFEKVYLRYEKEFIVLDLNYLDKDNGYYKKLIELLQEIESNDKYKELLQEIENGNKFKQLFSEIDDKTIDKQVFENLNKILKILSKAGIGGIMIKDSEYYKFEIPLYNGFDLNNIVHFNLEIADKNTELEKAYLYYLLDECENSYKLYENVIKKSLKSKNYIELFLSISNRNILLRLLRFDRNADRKKYNDLEPYDIEEKYQNIPNNVKQAISPIVSTLENFNFIYSFAFKISSILKEKEKQKNSIENGSIVYSGNLYEAELKLENLLLYTLGNGLAIDRYSEFKTVIEHFINIAIIRQVQSSDVTLNNLELFSCIKYIKDSDLELIFEPYIKVEDTKRFVLCEDKQKFLLKILANIVKHIRNDDNIVFPRFEENWKKTIFLFSIAKLDKKTLNRVLEGFTHVLNTSKNSISIYKAINRFLGLQYTLYKEEIDSSKLINIIEIVLNKIIYKNYNGHELHAIKSNYISNIYGYLGTIDNFNFDNKQLVDTLVIELNSWGTKEQTEISKYFLISLYYISSVEIKELIKDFIVNIDFSELKENSEKINFELFLLMNDFMDNPNINSLIGSIETEISKYRDGKSFSTILYGLEDDLKFLIEEKNLNQFDSLYSETKELLDNYEKQRTKSLF